MQEVLVGGGDGYNPAEPGGTGGEGGDPVVGLGAGLDELGPASGVEPFHDLGDLKGEGLRGFGAIGLVLGKLAGALGVEAGVPNDAGVGRGEDADDFLQGLDEAEDGVGGGAVRGVQRADRVEGTKGIMRGVHEEQVRRHGYKAGAGGKRGRAANGSRMTSRLPRGRGAGRTCGA